MSGTNTLFARGRSSVCTLLHVCLPIPTFESLLLVFKKRAMGNMQLEFTQMPLFLLPTINNVASAGTSEETMPQFACRN
jgi:hypothetical protein